MKKAIGIMACVAITVVGTAGTAAAVTIWNVPYWGSADGNPYAAPDGAVWAVYGATNVGYKGDPTNWTSYDGGLMIYDPELGAGVEQSWDWWTAPTHTAAGYPRYASPERLYSSGWDGVLYPASLTFTAPSAGPYSLDGTYRVHQVAGHAYQVCIGVWDAGTNDYTSLFEEVGQTPADSFVDFDLSSAVGDVVLQEGDRFAFIVSSYSTTYVAYTSFNSVSDDPVTITLIPEPATGVLFLGMLSLAALRRRRRRG